jgi:hypothetical protein
VAIPDGRKAVVLPFLDRVDLVASARAVLAHPQRAGARVQRHALIVADPEREDLGPRAGAADERVVLRHRAVGVDAEDLAHQAVELLRLRPVHGVDADAGGDARRHEQRAVGQLHRASADALGIQQRLHVLETGRVVRQSGPRDDQDACESRRARGVRTRGQRRIGEVDGPALREVAIRKDLEQTLGATRPELGQAAERCRRFPILSNQSDTTGPLAHDDPAIGQEVERKPACKPGRHRLDRKGLAVRGARGARLAEPGRNRRVAVRSRAAVGRRVGHLRRRARNFTPLLTC